MAISDYDKDLADFIRVVASTQGKTYTGADGRTYSYPPVRFDEDGQPIPGAPRD